MRRRAAPRDHTITTTTERINLAGGGYRIAKMTRTKYDKSLLDICIDLLS